MSKLNHLQTQIPKIKGAKIAILRTKWYPNQVDSMVNKCVEYLNLAECLTPEIYTVPGAVEIPLAALTLTKRFQRLEAIICFGGILKGDTLHFEMISNECFRGLGQVMLETGIPIINEIIPVYKIEDLNARSADDEKNKGIEAAYAAAEIISWRRQILI